MKRMLGIFVLWKSEQRVVLIVMLVLITFALLGYERRIHESPVQPTSAANAKPSPTATEIEDD